MIQDKPQFLTFEIPQDHSPREQASSLYRKAEEKRLFYYQLEEDQEKLDRCIKSITRNWKRDIAPEGSKPKIIMGYNEALDSKFRWKLWSRLRHGEKIC